MDARVEPGNDGCQRSSRIGSHTCLDDLVGVLHRLAALDLVDILHAFDDLAPDGVLVIQERGIVEADEELAIGRSSGLPARAMDAVPRTCGSLLNSA